MKSEAEKRKATPVYSGVLKYFPDALKEVARVSKAGNDQHNPGSELHWDRAKSKDELDACARHLVDRARSKLDTDGIRHLGKAAWRALAALQKEIEAEQHSEWETYMLEIDGFTPREATNIETAQQYEYDAMLAQKSKSQKNAEPDSIDEYVERLQYSVGERQDGKAWRILDTRGEVVGYVSQTDAPTKDAALLYWAHKGRLE